jgi:membrane-bound ClpP family serine protease
MKSVNIALRLTIGLIALALGVYRFRYIQPDWRSALIIAVGIWFLFRAFQVSRTKPSSRP